MHRHIWKIESKVTQQSAWEQITQHADVQEVGRANSRMFVQPVIVTYRCEGCGAQKVERV
jgi:hypothetical protein